MSRFEDPQIFEAAREASQFRFQSRIGGRGAKTCLYAGGYGGLASKSQSSSNRLRNIRGTLGRKQSINPIRMCAKHNSKEAYERRIGIPVPGRFSESREIADQTVRPRIIVKGNKQILVRHARHP